MGHYWFFTRLKKDSFILLGCILLGNILYAQQTKISDYVIFGGTKSVQLGSSNDIQGGFIGSYNLVQSTGSLTIGGSVFSGGSINLTNSNTVTGRLTAATNSGIAISVGSNANIGGNIDANGNIVVGGGSVSGIVTHPNGTTYSGPNPAGGNILGTPNIPILPNLPTLSVFPAAGSGNISNTQAITPGSYGNVTLGNNKTLTLSGTGVYVFGSILNSGNSSFVFDFKNDLTGNIKIYVWGDVDLGKVQTSIINGGNESRIYSETHGSGSTSPDGTVAFNIANGSGGQGNASRWSGSVWAPNGAINIGSGTGSTVITGALWSGTQVNVQSGVSMIFAPFNFCTPITANAGPDQTGTATCGQTSVKLAANNPSPGTGLWTVVSGAGGTITTPSSSTSTFTGTSGTTYTLRWTITNDPCPPSTDDVVITFSQMPTTANAGPDQIGSATCGLTSVTLAGNTPSVGTGSWSIVSGTGGSFGNITSPTSTFSGIAGNTYTLKWTISNDPCPASTDDVVITFNKNPQNVNAGPDKALDFTGVTKLKGTTSTPGTLNYQWSKSAEGVFDPATPTNRDSISVLSSGFYT
ncbi:MAG: hypothetical protein JJE22_07535, partial [Bacteroidia bacterium]|nr:hypothetical protein [Bacteroidia bacterium]